MTTGTFYLFKYRYNFMQMLVYNSYQELQGVENPARYAIDRRR